MEIGDKVKVKAGSLHANQTGTISDHYGNYVMLLADDQTYSKAFKRVDKQGKYFQVDAKQLQKVK